MQCLLSFYWVRIQVNVCLMYANNTLRIFVNHAHTLYFIVPGHLHFNYWHAIFGCVELQSFCGIYCHIILHKVPAANGGFAIKVDFKDGRVRHFKRWVSILQGCYCACIFDHCTRSYLYVEAHRVMKRYTKIKILGSSLDLMADCFRATFAYGQWK